MKKQLLFGALLICSTGAFAQTLSVESLPFPIPKMNKNVVTVERNITCPDDTVLYPVAKEYSEGTVAFSGFRLKNSQVPEITQGYSNAGTLTVKGISFAGNAYAGTSSAILSLYNVDANFMPTTLITSTTVAITTVQAQYTALFSSPQTVTANYAVGVKIVNATDSILIVLNSAKTNTYGEALAYLNFGGYIPSNTGFGATNDFEPIIAPIVSYNVATDFTVSPSVICAGQAVTFTNTTTPTSILGNRTYNSAAFDVYWNSQPDSTYFWSYGDGSPLASSLNGSHTYAAAGSYNATLATVSGLYTSCYDTKVTPVNVTVCTDIQENNAANMLSIYPNPSNGAFTVNLNNADKAVVEVYNVVGKVVYSTQLANNSASINLANQAAGMYFVKVISNNNTLVKQVIVTK